jgi:ABC-type amino acid transport substrate-binding protein
MAILSGLKESNGPQYMAVLADAGQVGYGIAVSKDTPQLASKIADALASMVQDGSWAKARNELKRQTHLKVTLTGTPTAIVSDTE